MEVYSKFIYVCLRISLRWPWLTLCFFVFALRKPYNFEPCSLNNVVILSYAHGDTAEKVKSAGKNSICRQAYPLLTHEKEYLFGLFAQICPSWASVEGMSPIRPHCCHAKCLILFLGNNVPHLHVPGERGNIVAAVRFLEVYIVIGAMKYWSAGVLAVDSDTCSFDNFVYNIPVSFLIPIKTMTCLLMIIKICRSIWINLSPFISQLCVFTEIIWI